MAVYDLYRDAGGDSAAIKQGFSWPAFFFGGAWALGKKMYGLGLAVMGLVATLAAIRIGSADGLTTGTDLVVEFGYLGVSLWLGIKGNDLRRKSLAARGFRRVAAGGRAVEPRQVVADLDTAGKGPGAFADDLDSDPDSNEALYDFVVRELAGNDYDLDLWTRVFSDMDGDRVGTRAEYIRIRIEQLRQR